MRSRHVAAAAFLPLPMLLPGAVQPAAAADLHTVTINGSMLVSEGPGVFQSGSTGNFTINRKALLRHAPGPNVRTLSFSFCQGGEVRGVLTVKLELTRFEYVTVTPRLQLFEGSSCSSTDLDGQQEALMTGVSADKKRTWTMRARNGEALSGDLVSTTFTVTNSTG